MVIEGAQRNTGYEISSRYTFGRDGVWGEEEFLYVNTRLTCKCEEETEIHERLNKAVRCARSMRHLLKPK